MSNKRNKCGSWISIVALLVSWLALALVFTLAPLWFGFRGSWPAIWTELALEPPPVTSFVADTWNLLLLRYGAVTTLITTGLVVVSIRALYRLSNETRFRWCLARLSLIVLPLAGVVLTVFAIYVAPRRQLAQALDLQRLPQYDLFPTYVETSQDASRTMEHRRQALYAIHVMCVLEQGGISPPADCERDSTTDAVNAYLWICSRDEQPTELRLFAAANLKHAFIDGHVAKYPADASFDRDAARGFIAEIYLDVVQDGGPGNYTAWRNSGYQPGQWAQSAFKNRSPDCEIVRQLANSLTDSNNAVRAEAAAALSAIGPAMDEVLELLAELGTRCLELIMQCHPKERRGS